MDINTYNNKIIIDRKHRKSDIHTMKFALIIASYFIVRAPLLGIVRLIIPILELGGSSSLLNFSDRMPSRNLKL